MPEEKIKQETPQCIIDEQGDVLDLIYERPHTLTDTKFHFCPGCGHSTVHKLIAEVIQEMNIQSDVIAVAPVGCAVFAYDYLDIDWQEAAHGRATAVATGIKRFHPDKYVFTYQGDGDLAAIGTAETIHSINRGENFMIIFINNAVYGMTSGQMAPTTLEGMATTTSPFGRDVHNVGYPIKVAELVSQLPGALYVTRQAVHTSNYVRKAKKAIMNGFKYQKLHAGTSLIEIVSNCPSNWKLNPVETMKFIDDKMLKYFPLGDIKVPPKELISKLD